MGFLNKNTERIVTNSTVSIRSLILDPSRTVIVNMNTVGGYFEKGRMFSPLLKSVLPKIVRTNEYFLNSRKLFIVDYHTDSSSELSFFPPHCAEYSEQQIIPELDGFAENAEIITKNSVNAFVSRDYIRWLSQNIGTIENIIITGGMTDTDVMQFALSQQAYCFENDREMNVIVMSNAVHSFDNDAHDGDDCHFFALYNMYINGIKLASI